MKGSCLCGEVTFALKGEIPNLYQCHCSLCRKVSGSSSNSAMLIKSENFSWLAGQHRISSYARSSGFRSDFCSSCGSPLPNPLKNGNGYWIPVGLLEGTSALEIGAHLYVNSKAPWDIIGGTCPRFEEMPHSETLAALLA